MAGRLTPFSSLPPQNAVRCQPWQSSLTRGDWRVGHVSAQKPLPASLLFGARDGHRMGAWERVTSGGPHGCPTAPQGFAHTVAQCSCYVCTWGTCRKLSTEVAVALGGGAAGRDLAWRVCVPLVSGASSRPSVHCLVWDEAATVSARAEPSSQSSLRSQRSTDWPQARGRRPPGYTCSDR